MTELCRLLNELPFDSPERELLSSGVAARPPAGSKERTWNALVLALGAGSAAMAGSTAASAATAVTAKATGAASTAAIAAPAVVSTVAAKSVALGFAIGMGVLGAGQVASRLTQRDQAPVAAISASASKAYARAPKSTNAAADARRSSIDEESLLAAPPAEATPVPLITLERATPIAAQPALAASEPPPPVASTEAPMLSASEPKPSSLAEQARGLARIQRLLDAGNTTEAIRQLELSLSSSDYSTLLEERDALYVQALFRAQRIAQGNLWAKRFIQRYPNSPHVEKMRRLLGEK